MRQIFLLSNNEMDNLKHGIPLEIALPGGAMIQLQAENPRRKYVTNNTKANGRGLEGVLSERIAVFLNQHGKSKSIDIIRGLGNVTKSSVTSCLSANRRGNFKSSGERKNRLWRVSHGTRTISKRSNS